MTTPTVPAGPSLDALADAVEHPWITDAPACATILSWSIMRPELQASVCRESCPARERCHAIGVVEYARSRGERDDVYGGLLPAELRAQADALTTRQRRSLKLPAPKSPARDAA